MILNPGNITLIVGSLLSAFYSVYASVKGLIITRRWDFESGSEQQSILEKKNHRISVFLTIIFGLSGLTLLLFLHTVDDIHSFFIGSMCAASSLNINKYGYPALITKLVIVFLTGQWLILNFIDTKSSDYPLIRIKYKMLIFISLLFVCEAYLLFQYFFNMESDLITACCGVQFSKKAGGIIGQMVSLPHVPSKILFYLSAIITVRSGINFYVTGRSVNVFSMLSVWLFLVSLVAIVSFVSVYISELPTQHCPFCLLKGEYYYIGYPLYISLFVGGIAGTGTGILERVKGRTASLNILIPDTQKKLCLMSLVGFVIFTLLATYPILFSDFRMVGY